MLSAWEWIKNENNHPAGAIERSTTLTSDKGTAKVFTIPLGSSINEIYGDQSNQKKNEFGIHKFPLSKNRFIKISNYLFSLDLTIHPDGKMVLSLPETSFNEEITQKERETVEKEVGMTVDKFLNEAEEKGIALPRPLMELIHSKMNVENKWRPVWDKLMQQQESAINEMIKKCSQDDDYSAD